MAMTTTSSDTIDATTAAQIRLLAVGAVARLHGANLDRDDFQGATPSPAALAEWARRGGLWAKATRLTWKQLVALDLKAPIVLPLNDGSAVLLVAADKKRDLVWIRHSRLGPADPPVEMTAPAMAESWGGDALLLRPRRAAGNPESPFSLAWVASLVWTERRAMRDVLLASLVLSVLTIVPALMVMTVINEVVTYQSLSTLVLISLLIGTALISETLLGYARRQLIITVAARVDARLNLHVFQRILRLPLDFFEHNQAGQIWSMTGLQVNKVRDFLTGKLMGTLLDLVTLLVLLPLLFVLQPALSGIVLLCAGIIAAVIVAFMRPMSRDVKRWIDAETAKSSVMVETLHGIRTVKSLALEAQQRDRWDDRVAAATEAKVRVGRLASLPQLMITPLEGFMQRGVLLVGAYLALASDSSVALGGLIGFMMLSSRVAQPLASLAKLIEDLGEVRTATALAASVLNRQPETADPARGLRPRFQGALLFHDVSFAYPGAANLALDRVSFNVRPGTVLGVVGRSGSGKSTVTRLLQGIGRDYTGRVGIDGIDLRDINLTHLRRNMGVVLQENFLFRGTIQENILAGRPGLSLADAVRAAHLAGAAEFVERLPSGYETIIEEGSPNLSGGQRQRLAIARALVHDPRLLILDEATSALDPESEALVSANLAHIARGRTMLIVSHRLASLVACDQILVLDQGRVMDIAPHQTLIARCPTYHQLWQQQNRHLLDAQPAQQGA
ncbi:MAG: peptidase domain-containing ABC transporter [Acetobacteraceae bacterium]|nr:peptidase domain-containing ABC transporter [Acetobacteraceae bacterium]